MSSDTKTDDESVKAEAVDTASAPEAVEEPAAEESSAKKKGGGGLIKAAVLLIVGAGAAIWGLPMIAPSLPAPIANLVAPAPSASDGPALAALEAEIEALRDELASVSQVAETAIAAAGGANDRLSEIQAAETALADRMDALEANRASRSEGRGDEALGALSDRIAALEASTGGGDASALAEQVQALDAQVNDLASALANGEGSDGAPDSAAMAAVQSQIVSIREGLAAVEARESADISAVQADLAALSEKVGALTRTADPLVLESLAARLAGIEAERELDKAARDGALAEAQRARRAATVGAALAEIDRAMTLGASFEAPLAEITDAMESDAPEALAAVATTGVMTREALKASFPKAAYAAIESMLQAEAAEESGVFSGVLASLEARVTGLPAEPIAGDSAPAVLSRARADLLGGDIDGAIAAIDALPGPAREAMADWTESARARSAADAALNAWRTDLKQAL